MTTISWNPACLDSTPQIDIYLYAPLQPTSSLPIHAWTHIPVSEGSYDVKLAPKWWNSNSSVELSINIVPTGNQPWDSSFSYGPAWFATYTAPTDGSAPPADAVVGGADDNKLIQVFYKGGQLTKGGMAAAIVVPLIVFFIALAIYIRKLHLNRNNKTADWAEHMDKRMSKISLDWTSGGDGRAGPIPGSRPASFMARPHSSYRPSVDAVRAAYSANVAGRGAGASTHGDDSQYGEMSEAHLASESMHTAGARQSNYRVSFAPSTDAGLASVGHQSRGHKTSASIPRTSIYTASQPPAVPRVDTQRFADNVQDSTEEEDFVMSPTQNQGATPFNFETLRKSMDEDMRRSMLSYPALEMVDGGEQLQEEEIEEPVQQARPISEAVNDSAYASDAVVSSHTGMLPPSNANSPDEALKQYAALRAAAGPSPAPSMTMRNLYGAQPSFPGHRAQQDSTATGGGSSINEDDVVGYNEMIDGHQRS